MLLWHAQHPHFRSNSYGQSRRRRNRCSDRISAQQFHWHRRSSWRQTHCEQYARHIGQSPVEELRKRGFRSVPVRILHLATFCRYSSYYEINVRSFVSQDASCSFQQVVINMTLCRLCWIKQFYRTANCKCYFTTRAMSFIFLCSFLISFHLNFWKGSRTIKYFKQINDEF